MKTNVQKIAIEILLTEEVWNLKTKQYPLLNKYCQKLGIENNLEEIKKIYKKGSTKFSSYYSPDSDEMELCNMISHILWWEREFPHRHINPLLKEKKYEECLNLMTQFYINHINHLILEYENFDELSYEKKKKLFDLEIILEENLSKDMLNLLFDRSYSNEMKMKK